MSSSPACLALRLPDNENRNRPFSTSLIQEIQQLSTTQTTLQQQLSTGLSITNPSDAPATVGNVLNQSAEMQSLQQLSANNATATSIAQQSYSSLSSLNQIATSASELATEGSDGTTSVRVIPGLLRATQPAHPARRPGREYAI